MDVLSEVLQRVRLSGALFFEVSASPPWVAATPSVAEIAKSVMPEAQFVLPFHVVLSGSCFAEIVDGSEAAVALEEGDIVVFTKGEEHVLASEPGLREPLDHALFERPLDRRLPTPFVLNTGSNGSETCHFVCGFLGCDSRPFNPLLDALPRLFRSHTSAATRAWVSRLVEVAVQESEQESAGGETMLARAAEVMFVEVVRKYMADLPDDASSWFLALRDKPVGLALRLIHSRPAYPWSIETLAREVGMSRSRFADRFARLAGDSPMNYLSRWRMQLAARIPGDGRRQCCSSSC